MRPLLQDAQRQGQLVRVWRGAMEHGSFCGYIGALGHEFFLMWVLGDNLAFDGVYALRHRDITEVEAPDKHHRFIEKALKLRQIEPLLPADFALDDAAGVVTSAVKQAAVIGVHVDSDDECEICYIGHLLAVEDDGFKLQEITPDAEWMTEPSFFGWDEISTVSYHDPYAEALLQVAGAPPPIVHGDGDSGFGRAR